MHKIFLFILFFLAHLACTQAAEREYVISNISRLLDSYSMVDFTKCTDEAVDSKKYDSALKVNEFNRQQSKTLKDLFEQFTQGKLDEDKLLRSVLDIRFRNINFFQRHKGFKFDPKINPFAGLPMGPGSSIICNQLTVNGGFSLIGEDYAKYIVGAEYGGVLLRFIQILEQDTYNTLGTALKHYEVITDPSVRDVFAHLVNDNLYVLAQIALGIFSILRPHQISYRTFDYISASRSLWPLLEKVAQGADPFLLDDDVSLFDNKALINEYEIYAMCLLEVANMTMVPLKGLGCIPSRDYVFTLGTLKDSGYILGNWSLPELPTTLEKLREPLISTMKSTTSIPESLAKEGTAKSAKLPATTQKREKSRQNKAKRPAQNSVQKPQDLANPAIVSSAPLIESVSSPAEATKSTLTTVSETESDIHSQLEHIFAGWSKKLRPKSNLGSIAVRKDPISPEQLNVLKNIFGDNTKITYEMFENLWHHLNGPNSIKKSDKRSLRRLLDSQGIIIGDVFVLYGAQHRYSDKNKGELESALTLIGYDKSYLASLEMQ